MQIKPEHLEQLEKEVQHIFDSGANEIRVYEMIQTFIEKRGQALFSPVVSVPKGTLYCEKEEWHDWWKNSKTEKECSNCGKVEAI